MLDNKVKDKWQIKCKSKDNQICKCLKLICVSKSWKIQMDLKKLNLNKEETMEDLQRCKFLKVQWEMESQFNKTWLGK